jgi:hypothetical protein
VVTPSTSVVLEGFPGSANSFAREAVLYSNPGALVASHIHTAAHVLEALRLGRPTVLQIRPPVDAIASYLSRGYPSEVEGALRAYERMHTRLLSSLDSLVVAPFDQITKRFGDVIEEVNLRFGSNLVPFPHHDQRAREAVFDRLEAYAREVAGDSAAMLQATPTLARSEQQVSVRAALTNPAHTALRERCELLYQAVTGSAPGEQRDERVLQLAS